MSSFSFFHASFLEGLDFGGLLVLGERLVSLDLFPGLFASFPDVHALVVSFEGEGVRARFAMSGLGFFHADIMEPFFLLGFDLLGKVTSFDLVMSLVAPVGNGFAGLILVGHRRMGMRVRLRLVSAVHSGRSLHAIFVESMR